MQKKKALFAGFSATVAGVAGFAWPITLALTTLYGLFALALFVHHWRQRRRVRKVEEEAEQ